MRKRHSSNRMGILRNINRKTMAMSAAALKLRVPQKFAHLRLDKVWYIKHPLHVITLDYTPHKSFILPLCTHLEGSLGLVWKKKGFPPFLSPLTTSLFPAAPSCNSKGRKGGNRVKTKRWKDWYVPSNLHWWAAEDSESDEMSWVSRGTAGMPI